MKRARRELRPEIKALIAQIAAVALDEAEAEAENVAPQVPDPAGPRSAAQNRDPDFSSDADVPT